MIALWIVLGCSAAACLLVGLLLPVACWLYDLVHGRPEHRGDHR